MTEDRVIMPEYDLEEDSKIEVTLRPHTFDEYIMKQL